MRLVLDTHTPIGWDNDRLPKRVTAVIQAADVVFVSAVTAWEIAIKSALGNPISIRHADAVRTLAPHHRDPFDRLLIVQAQIEDLTIVTRDPAFEPYDVAVRW